MRKPSQAIVQILLLLMAVIMIIVVVVSLGLAVPVGIGIISNTTNFGPVNEPANSSAEGGTITTLFINISKQATNWKGYVGNVTGQLSLRDSLNYSIYDWKISSITGEIYASRLSSIAWEKINCTNLSMIEEEDSALGIPHNSIDSINRTFNRSIHTSFYVSTIFIENSTCPAIATNINSTIQEYSESSFFQEILLDDGSGLVFVNIIEQGIEGYNKQAYDFQMIVPDSHSTSTATTYYFWAEII